MMILTEILQCPKTGNKLLFRSGDSVVRVERSDVTYPVVDGIIDFCPQTSDEISAAYDKIADRYNGILARPNVARRICNVLVWGVGGDSAYVETVLSYLPERFDGILRDVPVGTGAFTSAHYAKYPEATIIGVDSSMNMLHKAKDCFQQAGVKYIHLLRADASHLPLKHAAVDRVLSMNGWHAFADKRRAIAEIQRALRQQGKLVACGYVRGNRKISDWFVKHFGARKNYFVPPFFELRDIPSRFEGFKIIRQAHTQSIAYFEATKEEPHCGQTEQ